MPLTRLPACQASRALLPGPGILPTQAFQSDPGWSGSRRCQIANALINNRSIPISVQLALARQDEQEQYLFLGSRQVIRNVTLGSLHLAKFVPSLPRFSVPKAYITI
jgi:hypothetical protein